MHPLRHPRNAIVIGVVFVVIGVDLLGASRTIGGWHVDYAGVTMLLVPRRRDGDDGLRPHRRLDRTTEPRATTDACDELWNAHPRADGPVRHPGLGRARRAPPDRSSLVLVVVVLVWIVRRARPRPARRGAASAGIEPRDAAPASTCPGGRSPPILAAIGAVLLFLGPRRSAGRPRPRASSRLVADPAVLAGRGAPRSTTTTSATTARPCRRSSTTARRPASTCPARRSGRSSARSATACSCSASSSAAGSWRSGSSPCRDAARLAGRCAQGVRKTVEADTTGHLENIPAPRTPSLLLSVLGRPVRRRRSSLQAGWLPPTTPAAASGRVRRPGAPAPSGGRPRREPPAPADRRRRSAADVTVTAQGDRLRSRRPHRPRRTRRSRIAFVNEDRGHRPRRRAQGRRRRRASSTARSSRASRPRSTTSRPCRPATYTFICSVHPNDDGDGHGPVGRPARGRDHAASTDPHRPRHRRRHDASASWLSSARDRRPRRAAVGEPAPADRRHDPRRRRRSTSPRYAGGRSSSTSGARRASPAATSSRCSWPSSPSTPPTASRSSAS